MTEEQEIQTITEEVHVLDIKGKKFNLLYTLKAWRVIKKEFGGYKGIKEAVIDDPLEFMTDKMAQLIFTGLLDKEIKQEEIDNALDNCTMRDMRDDILPVVMQALVGSMPDPKEASNPQKAKTEK